jgi:hypothetical protein
MKLETAKRVNELVKELQEIEIVLTEEEQLKQQKQKKQDKLKKFFGRKVQVHSRWMAPIAASNKPVGLRIYESALKIMKKRAAEIREEIEQIEN